MPFTSADRIIDTKANVEALVLGADDEGRMAYATDDDKIGSFDGVAWSWTPRGVYWEPLTNGDPVTPELIFDASGDVVMVEVFL
jgi:hypothetical protein